MHIGFRHLKTLADELCRGNRERIHHISRFLLEVGARQRLQDSWVRSFRVVVKEKIFVSQDSLSPSSGKTLMVGTASAKVNSRISVLVRFEILIPAAASLQFARRKASAIPLTAGDDHHHKLWPGQRVRNLRSSSFPRYDCRMKRPVPNGRGRDRPWSKGTA